MKENYCTVLLNNRTIITLTGHDAASFLQRTITTDINQISDCEMFAGALLSPQGKIIVDFLLGVKDKIFYIDIFSILADSFIKSLYNYKLNAKVEIKKEKYSCSYIICYSNPGFEEERDVQQTKEKFCLSKLENNDSMLIFLDKRFSETCSCVRIYTEKKMEFPHAPRMDWNKIRILYGIAEAVIDFAPFTMFPHDINYDQIGGISFKKGCYIGQEVISRMQRNVVKRRVLVATGTEDLLLGKMIEVNGKYVGVLGTVVTTKALALVRIDRIRDAINTGLPIVAHSQQIVMSLPKNVHFNLIDHD